MCNLPQQNWALEAELGIESCDWKSLHATDLNRAGLKYKARTERVWVSLSWVVKAEEL